MASESMKHGELMIRKRLHHSVTFAKSGQSFIGERLIGHFEGFHSPQLLELSQIYELENLTLFYQTEHLFTHFVHNLVTFWNPACKFRSGWAWDYEWQEVKRRVRIKGYGKGNSNKFAMTVGAHLPRGTHYKMNEKLTSRRFDTMLKFDLIDLPTCQIWYHIKCITA